MRELFKTLMPLAELNSYAPDHFSNVMRRLVNDSFAMEAIETVLRLSVKSHKASTAIHEALDLCSPSPISCLLCNVSEIAQCPPRPGDVTLRDIGSSSGASAYQKREILDYIPNDVV
jgi:hypothetical protein